MRIQNLKKRVGPMSVCMDACPQDFVCIFRPIQGHLELILTKNGACVWSIFF